MGAARKRDPELVYRGDKPVAVIIDIGDYEEMLERLEDIEDLKALQKMREKPMKFRKFDDFLKDEGLEL
jgi:PHD/YefM family antitoxin component YafN of YafNO toxin-antitoxin module